MSTPYMVLVLPTPGTTTGLLSAQEIVTALTTIDSHDHSAGKGALVTPAGLNINADLAINGNRLLGALIVGINAQASLDTSHAGSLQSVGNTLYWVNPAGASAPLGISGLQAKTISTYPYTVSATDAQNMLVIDSTSARTINLPAATTAMYFSVKDGKGQAATNHISIVPNGTDKIDGANATLTVSTNYGYARLVSDGVSQWYTI